METHSLRMNGSWTRRTLTLVLLAFLSHNAVCQDFLGEEDRKGIDRLFEIMTVEPDVPVPRGDGADFEIITSVYSDVMEVTSFWPYTPSPGGEDTEIQPKVPETSITVSDGEWRERYEIACVNKEEVRNRNAVKLNLKLHSNCSDTITRMSRVVTHLCKERCKFEIYQEENSNEAIILGRSVEADAESMAAKFEADKVKSELGVREAAPYWGKRNSPVFISLLVAGLLLAALLIGGYVLKNHRGHNAKGMRLADESFQVDEESQGNTLVSVAPLPQEPQPPEKPSLNGESPDGGKTQPPPTNGHQAAKTPVADTEL